ncbi:hypothetical protein OIDMADRAFT_174147 [Oidiodendron maius Zn]|uniref:BZIP domain-containing protein n=1 Tax=Oidiodendron maius (strain Zn) TaxID=913774 RepID=A0A0C3HW46_OIDMZ|nr:hypothetical protein OIDMADRAFT_174147 [Oidiodendron maius Zn]
MDRPAQTPGTKVKYKRRMTEKRRQQNREAQRNYRLKQIARVAELERIATRNVRATPTETENPTSDSTEAVLTSFNAEAEKELSLRTQSSQPQHLTAPKEAEDTANSFPEIDTISETQFNAFPDMSYSFPVPGEDLNLSFTLGDFNLTQIPLSSNQSSINSACLPNTNSTLTYPDFAGQWQQFQNASHAAQAYSSFDTSISLPNTPFAGYSSSSQAILPPVLRRKSLASRTLAWHSFQYLSQLEVSETPSRLFSRVLEQKLDIETIFYSGIKASAGTHKANDPFFHLGELFVTGLQILTNDKPLSLNNSPFRPISRLITPSPESSCFRMLQMPLVDAFLQCAKAVGLLPEDFFDHCCFSPFFRPEANASNVDSIRATLSKGKPRSLRPTNEQIMQLHHPFLDILPFPSVRSRALDLMSCSPPKIDYWDLKKDVGDLGLVCWQTDRSSAADPTDGRSWEAEPWFLKKWWMLLGGEDGEVWESTMWWRKFRGDSLSIQELDVS